MLSSAAATVITEPVAFSLAGTSVVDDSCVVMTLVALVLLALVVLLLVVVIVAVAVVGLVVPLAEDVNVDDVVLTVVVFFVGRGLVEVSKWDVVM